MAAFLIDHVASSTCRESVCGTSATSRHVRYESAMRRITYISASVKTDAIDPLRKSGGRAHTCDRNKLRRDHGKVSAAGPPSSLSTSAWHRSYRGTWLGPCRSLVQFVGRGYLVEKLKSEIDKTARAPHDKKEWWHKTHNPAAHARSVACTRGSVWQVGGPAMAAGACIGASAAPIAGSAAKTKRRCERSSGVVPRRACSPSTAIWQWAGARSRRAMLYPGLIACGGSDLWTICPSGQSPVSLCAGAIAGKGSCLNLSLQP